MDAHIFKTIAIQALELVTHLCFPAIVFTISSRITLRDVLGELKRPVLLVKILLVGCVFVPLVTAGVLRLFNLPRIVAAIILVASIAPGDSFALLEVKDKKGRVTLAAVIMAWLCLAMPFTVPAWTKIFGQWFNLKLMVSPLEVFKTIAPLTLLPLFAGIFIRHFYPLLSQRLERIVAVFAKCSIAIAAVVGLLLSLKAFHHYTISAMGAIGIVVTCALVLGYYSGCGDRRDRISMALSASLGNFAVILLIAHLNYPHAHVAGAALAFILIRWLVIMFWYIVMRVRLRLKGEIFG
ncbi:MAG: hypothetical protein WCI77_00860 [Candidatus Omnitrophota bacterium]